MQRPNIFCLTTNLCPTENMNACISNVSFHSRQYLQWIGGDAKDIGANYPEANCHRAMAEGKLTLPEIKTVLTILLSLKCGTVSEKPYHLWNTLFWAILFFLLLAILCGGGCLCTKAIYRHSLPARIDKCGLCMPRCVVDVATYC